MGLLITSMVIAFGVVNLDQLLVGPHVRLQVQSWLSSSCLDDRALSGEAWRVATHMWIHGSLVHLVSNLVSLVGLWLLARRCFRSSEWFYIFLLSGSAAGPIQLLLQPVAGPDFTKWAPPLVSYFGQPNSPLVGASGGICGLWGALSAVALRYWATSGRGAGQPDPGRAMVWWLTVPFLLQVAIDSQSPGVAGAGHIAGFICGFVIAAAPRPIRPAYLEHRP